MGDTRGSGSESNGALEASEILDQRRFSGCAFLLVYFP